MKVDLEGLQCDSFQTFAVIQTIYKAMRLSYWFRVRTKPRNYFYTFPLEMTSNGFFVWSISGRSHGQLVKHAECA